MVPITIKDPTGLKRYPEPVKIGVPFPIGRLESARQLQIINGSSHIIPSQVTPLAHWPDGSIQWALLEFFAQIEPDVQATYHASKSPAPSNDIDKQSIAIEEKATTITISTGTATFEIPRNIFRPFQNVSIEGKNIISAQGTEFRLIGSDGKTWIPIPKSFEWITKGLIRTSLRINGHFSADNKQPLAFFTAILDFWVNSSFCSLSFQIHNFRAALHPGGLWDLGDPGSIHFKDLSLIIPVAPLVASVEVCSEIQEEVQSFSDSGILLYQDSSGGKQWDSPNHIDHRGMPTVSFPGYKLWLINTKGRDLVREGKRATPYFKINTPKSWISGGIQNFWQNFPKALSLNSSRFKISLFPEEASVPFELQGGERKTHTIFLDFGLPDSETIIPQILSPLQISLDPEWIRNSKAVPYLIPQHEDSNKEYLSYVTNAIEGPNSFFEKREKIDEYGWRNFGDLYADHEAVHHKGERPFISHYNNQFDFIYGAGVHFLRTSDQKWYDFMVDLARHVVDIDIYHTDDDKPAYNHGLFWHTDHYRPAGRSTHRTYSSDALSKRERGSSGGGPSNEHNYTSGLLLYHYITGNVLAREVVIELANWVIDGDDGRKTMWAFIDEGPTGLASQTVFTDYHGPGRGAGNSINALIDAYKLTKDRKYLDKAEELICRCIHPEDDINKLRLDNPEYKWSYLVFLQILGKYLDFKLELGESDWHFFYARDSLLHYSKWMLEHEVPYKELLHKVEIPTETWPAQDIRKSCVLNYACKYGPREMREAFKTKARFFFERCLKDLLSFDTAYLTRPMVILTVYGYMQAYFDFSKEEDFAPFKKHNYNFGKPSLFKPQKMRLKDSAGQKAANIAKLSTILVKGVIYSIKNRLLK